MASAITLLLMALLYLAMQLSVLHANWSTTWARAAVASGLWLVVWAGVTVYLRWLAGEGGRGAYSTSQRLLLIELAVFGFAMNSIYGFGQMLLPGLVAHRLGAVGRSKSPTGRTTSQH
jgi:hypothetical protein